MADPSPVAVEDATAGGGGAGFAIRVAADGYGTEPVDYDDPNGAWPKLLTTAPLGDVIIADADVEAVATAPLRFLVSAQAGARLVAAKAEIHELRFIATFDGARLYAGRQVFYGTARAHRHPVLHVDQMGGAVVVTVLPRLGDRKASALVAPDALVAHFQRDGRLVPPGAPLGSGFATRRFSAQAIHGKPGSPGTRVTLECKGSACKLTTARKQVAGDWSNLTTKDIPVAELDAVWALFENHNLFDYQPGPGPANVRVFDAPTIRIELDATRRTGEKLERRFEWTLPSTADQAFAPVFAAARDVALRVGGFELRYFPGAP